MTATTPESAAADPAQDNNKMPSSIKYIVSNELAERFCYYGINSILAVYLTSYLHYTESSAVATQSMFKVGAFFFPLVGAVVADALWGKFKTIVVFSSIYAAGCAALALFGTTELALGASLFFIGFGTGGIKPCVSTNVGDQFTSKNSHLIERAFSFFYLAINLGSSFSIYLCPELLDDPNWGPKWAFGVPAIMMTVATLVFISGRSKYAVVPPAGKKWLRDLLHPRTLRLMGSLLIIYFFVAAFWMLWDQSNGNTWVLQMESALVDKTFFGHTFLPAQIQVVNGIFILIFAPLFSYVVYPFISRFTAVTPLRKIGAGLFITVGSFLIVAWIERQIFSGVRVHAAWQVLAYAVLSIGEVLVSITALEFSYTQAPFTLKSFIMALFLLSIAAGNLGIAAVNKWMIRPIPDASIVAGEQTWIQVPVASDFVVGQKVNLSSTGMIVAIEGKDKPLQGTFVAAEVDTAGSRVRLIDNVTRQSLVSSGTFDAQKGLVATTRLVGAQYFLFFAEILGFLAFIYIFVARRYKEESYVRAA